MKRISMCLVCVLAVAACGSASPTSDQVPSSAPSSESVLLPESSGAAMGIPSMTGGIDLATQGSGTASTVSDMVDPDEQTIRQFYAVIQEHAFAKAYELYGVKKLSLQAFESRYQDIVKIDVADVQKRENGSYAIRVNLEDSAGSLDAFDVIMVVKDGKIETKSSKQVKSSASASSQVGESWSSSPSGSPRP